MEKRTEGEREGGREGREREERDVLPPLLSSPSLTPPTPSSPSHPLLPVLLSSSPPPPPIPLSPAIAPMVKGAQGAISQHGDVAVQENFEMKADTVKFKYLLILSFNSHLKLL